MEKDMNLDKVFPDKHIVHMTKDVVSAFVSNNTLDSDSLPGVIQKVYDVFCKLSEHHTFMMGELPEPYVAIEDSIQPDYIVCLEDGKRRKMLKRHLKTYYNMTPDQYRERWGLPASYPMVAPNYTKKRSSLAKNSGLGHIRSTKTPRHREAIAG